MMLLPRLALLLALHSVVLWGAETEEVFATVTAFPFGESSRPVAKTANSTLSSQQASAIAEKVKAAVPGTMVYSIQASGSKKPLFDGNCMLLTEPAAFKELAVGDIVVFRQASTGTPIVHRILEKRTGGFWTKGDSNVGSEDELVTPKNYLSRIYGVIYTDRNKRTPATTTVTTSATLASANN